MQVVIKIIKLLFFLVVGCNVWVLYMVMQLGFKLVFFNCVVVRLRMVCWLLFLVCKVLCIVFMVVNICVVCCCWVLVRQLLCEFMVNLFGWWWVGMLMILMGMDKFFIIVWIICNCWKFFLLKYVMLG